MDLTINKENLDKIKCDFVVANPVTREPAGMNMSIYKGKFIVYAIIDLTNQKKYIGSTIDFNNRVNHYIYDWINPNSNTNYKIVRIMREKGIDKFIIFPIDVATNRYELREKEREYIIRYNTTDPAIGYNRNIDTMIGDKHYSYGGHPHGAYTKANKAKFVAAVNAEDKIMYISEGMKLFADITQSTKDLVKNSAKGGLRHRKFYIVYLNHKDRIVMYDKIQTRLINAMNVLNGVVPGCKRGRAKAKFDQYLQASDLVTQMIEDGTPETFEKNGYACYYLHYDLTNEKPYIIDPIEKFFESVDICNFENR